MGETFIVVDMLLYTRGRTYQFYRGNHLLWINPGYQVDSGQNENRKAQSQVEMAHRRKRK